MEVDYQLLNYSFARMQPNTHWSSHDTFTVKEGHNSYILGILSIEDCAIKACYLEVGNWLSIGQFYVWECETISWVLKGSCEKIFLCNCFLIHAEYRIEDNDIFSNNISLRNYLCCAWFDSSLLHVIDNYVFNYVKYL